MSAKNITDYRNSFSLVPNNLHNCNARGQTFRGRHANVQVKYDAYSSGCSDRLTQGTAKPGPTTDTSSRIARLKKLQKELEEILVYRVKEELIEDLTQVFKMLLQEQMKNQEEHSYLVTTEMFLVKLQELEVHQVMSYTLRMFLRECLLIIHLQQEQIREIIKFFFFNIIMINKLVAEFLGTLFFLYIILATGDAVAIGLGLMAVIFILGKTSGGHFNPAVSVVMAMSGK